jgi:hypothetical protein
MKSSTLRRLAGVSLALAAAGVILVAALTALEGPVIAWIDLGVMAAVIFFFLGLSVFGSRRWRLAGVSFALAAASVIYTSGLSLLGLILLAFGGASLFSRRHGSSGTLAPR